MKLLTLGFFVLFGGAYAQDIAGIQVFNPKLNDETPIIGPGEHLVIRFDDLSPENSRYQYTIQHFDKNWEEDGLFFTEYAEGSMNVTLDEYRNSFNTIQRYKHYEFIFPNEKLQPKISGNYKIIIYKTSPDEPVFTREVMIHENQATILMEQERFAVQGGNAQRIQASATIINRDILNTASSMDFVVYQNNNPQLIRKSKSSGLIGSTGLLFQNLNLVYPGNSEFFYFENRNLNAATNMVALTQLIEDSHWETHLYPALAYPTTYQGVPDANGAFYFRRNDYGQERDSSVEGDYSDVYFYLESPKIEQELYVLGQFNSYIPSSLSMMTYDKERKRYSATIKLKQGFYGYIIGLKKDNGEIDYGAVNGNFWQTENTYQGLLYYRPFGRNYDGIVGYGEIRRPRASGISIF